MTFDLTPEQQTLIATRAQRRRAPGRRPLDAVLVLEERASHDPADAARFGFEGVGGRSNTTALLLPGLEGSEAALASIPRRAIAVARQADRRRGGARRGQRGVAHAIGVDEEDRREARAR